MCLNHCNYPIASDAGIIGPKPLPFITFFPWNASLPRVDSVSIFMAGTCGRKSKLQGQAAVSCICSPACAPPYHVRRRGPCMGCCVKIVWTAGVSIIRVAIQKKGRTCYCGCRKLMLEWDNFVESLQCSWIIFWYYPNVLLLYSVVHNTCNPVDAPLLLLFVSGDEAPLYSGYRYFKYAGNL